MKINSDTGHETAQKLTEFLKRCGICQEEDILPYSQSLIDEIIAKPRINKEMPKIIVLNTSKHSQDFLDTCLQNRYNQEFLKDKTDEEIAFEIQEFEKELDDD